MFVMIIDNLDKKIVAKDIMERCGCCMRTAQKRMKRIREELGKKRTSDITWREFNEIFDIKR